MTELIRGQNVKNHANRVGNGNVTAILPLKMKYSEGSKRKEMRLKSEIGISNPNSGHFFIF